EKDESTVCEDQEQEMRWQGCMGRRTGAQAEVGIHQRFVVLLFELAKCDLAVSSLKALEGVADDVGILDAGTKVVLAQDFSKLATIA
ncbi:hypothetical protein BN1708_019620, partial [Verticillium longisporum]